MANQTPKVNYFPPAGGFQVKDISFYYEWARDHGLGLLPIVFGPTATGKTRLALRLARSVPRPVIFSFDSRQVYRHLDIGTGKDLSDYGAVPHRLIDLVDPTPENHFSRQKFQAVAENAFQEETARGNQPILCGGTGYYLSYFLFDGRLPEGTPATNKKFTAALEKEDISRLKERLFALSPTNYRRTDRSSRRRLARSIEISLAGGRLRPPPQAPAPYLQKFIPLFIYPRPENRRKLDAAIGWRLRARLTEGLVAEGKFLLDELKLPPAWLDRLGLEYRWLARYLTGQIGLSGFQRGLFTDIRRMARGQITFFDHFTKENLLQAWREAVEKSLLSSGREPDENTRQGLEFFFQVHRLDPWG